MGVTVVSWNIATRIKPWAELVAMDADVALLQESRRPPADVADDVDIGPEESWDSHSWNSDWWRERWPALYDRWPMVVRLSDRVDVEWFRQVSPDGWPEKDEISVSGIGTVAAARVTPKDGSTEPFIVVSMYGRWAGPHPSVGASWEIYADASVHRIISDLAAFIGHDDPRTHRILAAGDLNITYGYGHGSGPYWDRRYETVFERMESIGLEFMGPQLPNGRKAEILATGEPEDSENVVTYHLPNRTPATASNNQFDFAFASRGFHESINVRALNEADEWGSSDHCRLLIEIAE